MRSLGPAQINKPGCEFMHPRIIQFKTEVWVTWMVMNSESFNQFGYACIHACMHFPQKKKIVLSVVQGGLKLSSRWEEAKIALGLFEQTLEKQS